MEGVTGLRRAIEAEHRCSLCRTNLLDALSTLVEHGLHTSVVGASQHDVAHMQGTVAHEHRCHIAATLVQT